MYARRARGGKRAANGMASATFAVVGRAAVVLLALVLLPLARSEEPADRTRHLLAEVKRDRDPVAWKEAVDQLRAGTDEERAALDEALLRLAAKRARDLDGAVRRIDALAAKVGDGERYERRRLAWEEACAHANAWLFDEIAFPDPREDQVVTGPMEGYETAKRRGDEAIAAWKRLEGPLARALRPLEGLTSKKAQALRAAHDEARAAFRRVRAELSETRREGRAEPAVDPLAALFLHLALGDLPVVAEAYAGRAPGWRTLCLFDAYCRAVVAWNQAHPFGMEKTALAGMQGINAYRRVLGISPVAHNEKLVRAAFGHSDEMTRMGYFSHRSPVAGRTTKEDRAALEGYTEQLVECITGAGGGMQAVEFWKYDGGHHRDMIHPKWKEGGLSTRGPAVYLGGAGEPGCIPGLRYGS